MKGLTFGDKHTYRDFGLKMLLPFDGFSSPEVRTEYQEVPGRSGVLDLSEALTGEPIYKPRTFIAQFDLEEPNPIALKQKISDIRNYLHGRTYKIVDDDEPEWYYQGRISMSFIQKNHRFYEVTLSSGNVHPYKFKNRSTVVPIEVLGEEQEIVLLNSRKTVIPEIACTGEITVANNDITRTLGEGVHLVPDFVLTEGENFFVISGSGTITFSYREGSL